MTAKLLEQVGQAQRTANSADAKAQSTADEMVGVKSTAQKAKSVADAARAEIAPLLIAQTELDDDLMGDAAESENVE